MAAMTKFVRAAWRDFLNNGGHDTQCLKELKITKAVPGKVYATMEVGKIHSNRMGSLHGGNMMSIVDSLGSLSLSTRGLWQTGVSVDIHTSFVRGAPMGTTLHCVSEIVNSGKTLAFTKVELLDAKTGKLLAQGTHTKFIGNALGNKHGKDVVFSADGESVVEGQIPEIPDVD